MGHTSKKKVTLVKTGFTLVKMGETWGNGSLMEKNGHTCKNETHLQKRVTFGKMGHTEVKGSHLQ